MTRVDITTDILLEAYRHGVFPMAETADAQDFMWIEPRMRGILPLDQFHIPRSLRKVIRKTDMRVTINTCFREVVDRCADRTETWINGEIKDLYTALHHTDHAHSVEVWKVDTLVGGLYGVHIDAAFFGESMFSTEDNASKIALVYLVAHLKAGGFRLLDTQFTTTHLEQFGVQEIPQQDYKALLSDALTYSATFSALSASASSPESVLQLSSQTS